MLFATPTPHYRKFFARLVKWAMTREHALETLGFASGSSPTEDEVRKAQRVKVVELGHEHGGDPKAITEANVAAEILKGNYRADNEPYRYNRNDAQPPSTHRPTREEGGGWDPSYSRPDSPPKREEVTFEQAKTKASIPSDVEWLFVTPYQRGQGSYSGDESSQRKEGWVAFGQTNSKYVFVGVAHSAYSAYFVGGGGGHDIYKIRTYEYDKSTKLSPSWLHGNVSKILKDMDLNIRFNSKVMDARGRDFKEAMPSKGADVSIKHIMVELGMVEGDDASVANRKQVVEAKLVRDFGNFGSGEDKSSPGFYPEPKGSPMWWDGKYHGSYYKLVLVLNGKEFALSEADWNTFCRMKSQGKKLRDAIFGEYGENKNITRMPKAKANAILGGMAEHFKDLPAAALAVLVKAAEQTKTGTAA